MAKAEIVFVASPLRADIPDVSEEVMAENQAFARDFCRKLWKKTGEIPIAPHLYFPQFYDDRIDDEREAGIIGGQAMLTHICKKLYVVGPLISEGMQYEIDLAQKLEIPIIYVESPDEFFTEKNGVGSE